MESKIERINKLANTLYETGLASTRDQAVRSAESMIKKNKIPSSNKLTPNPTAQDILNSSEKKDILNKFKESAENLVDDVKYVFHKPDPKIENVEEIDRKIDKIKEKIKNKESEKKQDIDTIKAEVEQIAGELNQSIKKDNLTNKEKTEIKEEIKEIEDQIDDIEEKQGEEE